MGKGAIGLMVNLDKLKGQMGLQQINNQSRPAIAGIDHDLQGSKGGEIQVAEQVGDIVRLIFIDSHLPLAGNRRKIIPLGQFTDGIQTTVAADGSGPLPNQLHAIVISGIMTGGDHNAAVHLPVKGSEVDLFGTAQADIHHLNATVRQSADQGIAEGRAAKAYIVSHHDSGGLKEPGIGQADTIGDILVQLGRHLAADIVGLKAG
jgi:hypothetical protein